MSAVEEESEEPPSPEPISEEYPIWSAYTAEARPDLRDQVSQFQSIGTEAGEKAEVWLRDQSLICGTATTYLVMLGGKLQGYFALCNAEVVITREEAESDLGVSYIMKLPATCLAWIAKSRDAEVSGFDIYQYALGLVYELAQRSASVALVLDPADWDVHKIWVAEPYGFLPTQEKKGRNGPNSPPRLWRPLEIGDL